MLSIVSRKMTSVADKLAILERRKNMVGLSLCSRLKGSRISYLIGYQDLRSGIIRSGSPDRSAEAWESHRKWLLQLETELGEIRMCPVVNVVATNKTGQTVAKDVDELLKLLFNNYNFGRVPHDSSLTVDSCTFDCERAVISGRTTSIDEWDPHLSGPLTMKLIWTSASIPKHLDINLESSWSKMMWNIDT